MLMLLAACSAQRLPIDPQDDENTSSTSSGSTSSTMSSETSSSETNNVFVPEYDQPPSQCDVFMQDCPDGDKCVPYSSSGDYFDGFTCVPVTGDQTHGEPCSYAGISVATDDCDAHSGCWNIQEIDGAQVGICHAFCMGTADNPECPQGSTCLISSSGSPGYCIIACDPVIQDCGPGLGCYWTSSDFQCVFTTLDIPAGEPCSFLYDCAPGLLCATADALPTCNGAACCTPFCDVNVGDLQCDVLPGTNCQLFYEEGMAPPGYEDVGVCAVPAPRGHRARLAL